MSSCWMLGSRGGRFREGLGGGRRPAVGSLKSFVHKKSEDIKVINLFTLNLQRIISAMYKEN